MYRSSILKKKKIINQHSPYAKIPQKWSHQPGSYAGRGWLGTFIQDHRADDMDALACPIASFLLALTEPILFPVTVQLLSSSAIHMWTTVNLNQVQQNTELLRISICDVV